MSIAGNNSAGEGDVSSQVVVLLGNLCHNNDRTKCVIMNLFIESVYNVTLILNRSISDWTINITLHNTVS